MVVSPGSYNGFWLTFTNTSREGNISNPQHDGITNLYVMQPTTLGGSTDPQPGTLFTNAGLGMAVAIHGAAADGLQVPTATWPPIGPTAPSRPTRSGPVGAITGGSGVTHWHRQTTGAGLPWEVCVALANETGKDIYINIPSNASLDLHRQPGRSVRLRQRRRQPYTSPQANPVWAPLNSNLKVYIEFSNEIWNSGFIQAGTQGDGWCNQLSQRAVYDYLRRTTRTTPVSGRRRQRLQRRGNHRPAIHYHRQQRGRLGWPPTTPIPRPLPG